MAKKTVVVTRAQRAAAKALVERNTARNLVTPDSIRRIAEARPVSVA